MRFVKDTPLRFALRETKAIFLDIRVVVALIAIAAILTIAEPFGTAGRIRLVPRAAYWLLIVGVTFAAGAMISAAINRAFSGRPGARWKAMIAVSLVTGAVVMALVLSLNWLVFGTMPIRARDAYNLAINVFAVSTVISAAVHLTFPVGLLVANDDAVPGTPEILNRIALAKRGALISLSVQDHYVEVVTDKGSSLILMRLGDAIRDARPTPGLQVHRSHWVAADQVARSRRQGARAILTLVDGREIPVSRTYLADVKAAGLL